MSVLVLADGFKVVTISIPGSGHTLDQLIEDLVRPLLLAAGYHPDTIADCFGENDGENDGEEP